MSGRKEIDDKNELWIKNKLSNLPDILSDYMLSIDDKTSWSRRNYLGYLIQFFEFLRENDIDVEDENSYKNIKPLFINRYLDYISYRIVNGEKRENKAGIKAAKLFAVSNFFEFLLNNDIIEYNPCKRIKTPKDKEEKEIVSMTPEEVKKLENNILNRGKYRGKKYTLRDLAIVMLGVSTGLRVSAIIEIDVDDIDFANSYIRVVEKGKNYRNVFIGNKTKDVLQQWIIERNKLVTDPKCKAVFISKNKTRMSTVSVRKMLTKETQCLDKHITPHKMRSTCATNLYDACGDIYLVQAQLGHKNIQNTRRYAKLSDNKMIEASDILNNII